MIAAWPSAAAPLLRVLELAAPRLPRAAAHAEAALSEALAPLASSSWPEVAWQFSRLNGDGFPAEFTFSSAGPAIRYTAEAAGPEMREEERAACAARWTGKPGLVHWARTVAPDWQRAPLRWGAWVGGCHTESVSRRKMYVETTAAGAMPVDGCLPAGAALQFVGLVDDRAECERYFRRNRLGVADLGRLLRGVSMRDAFNPLRRSIAATLPWPAGDMVLPTDAGFSTVGGAVSLFTFGRSVWGGDGAIRRGILDLASRNGWDFDLYEQVTRPLEAATGPRTCHGILAWIAVPGAPIDLRISVRPPG